MFLIFAYFILFFSPNIIIDEFIFVVVFSGDKNWHSRAYFIEQIRSLVDKYPQFNVTVFDYDGTIFDLIITVKVSDISFCIILKMICSFSPK
jgi:hypothetical protein